MNETSTAESNQQQLPIAEHNKPVAMGAKNWFLVWALGMAGQLCWCVENTWFANYLYADFGYYVEIVTAMTIMSALATTFSTFLFGTLSDRIGKRKPFIVFGYLAWGVATLFYGLTHLYADAIISKVWVIGIIIVMTDTVMSFLGSAGNDSGFNAWCSDMLNDKNRGGIGMALAAQPVLGTLIGTVVGGMIIDMPIFTDNGADVGGGYMAFFIIMGVMVIIFGIIAQFTMKDSPRCHVNKQGGFWHQFASVFNFKEFFKHKELVAVNLCVTIYFIGFNCYFIHIMNWLSFTLGFGADSAGLLFGIPLFVAAVATIGLVPLINRDKSPIVALGAIICAVVGCLMIFFFVGDGSNLDPTQLICGPNIVLIVAILLIGLGYVGSIQTYMVWMKKLYPQDQRGQFEGIRILFFVLFPMVAGPLIADPIIRATGRVENINLVEGVSVAQNLPTHWLFLAAAIITLFTLVPLFFATKRHNARISSPAQEMPAEVQTTEQNGNNEE